MQTQTRTNISAFAGPAKALTWAFIRKLDGTPWATAGFSHPDRDSVWQWAAGLVAKELECEPDAVGIVGDLLTVDGLPCFKLLC